MASRKASALAAPAGFSGVEILLVRPISPMPFHNVIRPRRQSCYPECEWGMQRLLAPAQGPMQA